MVPFDERLHLLLTRAGEVQDRILSVERACVGSPHSRPALLELRRAWSDFLDEVVVLAVAMHEDRELPMHDTAALGRG